MVGHVVGLRLALLRNRVTGGRDGALAVVGSVLFGGLASAAAAVTLAGGATVLHQSVLVWTAIVAAWALGPLVGIGADRAIDPELLATLPLTSIRRATALIAAALAGLPALGTMIVLSGTVAGAAQGIGGVLAGSCAVALVLIACVTASRICAGLARRAASRRAGVLLAPLTALVLSAVVAGLLAARIDVAASPGSDALAAVAGWTVPGLGVRALLTADRDALAALGLIALGAAQVAALVAVLAATLRSAPAPARGGTALSGPFALATTPRGGALAKELASALRDPVRRPAWLIAVALGAALVVLTAIAPRMRGAGTPVLAVLVTLAPAIASRNLLAADRGGTWVARHAGLRQTMDLGARVAVNTALATLAALATALALGALVGSWSDVPAAVLLALATALVGVGIGALASVVAPIPIGDRPGPAARAIGAGGVATTVQSIAAIVQVGAMAPILAVALAAGPGGARRLTVGAVAALLYGAVVAWGLTARAARRLTGAEPELTSSLSPRRAS